MQAQHWSTFVTVDVCSNTVAVTLCLKSHIIIMFSHFTFILKNESKSTVENIGGMIANLYSFTIMSNKFRHR